jgi:GWxTD domain-containing protein
LAAAVNIRRAAAPALLAAWLFLAAAGPQALCGQTEAKSKPPDRYKTWLEDEVAYIIAPAEREVFLKLQTDRERDLFIEAFWKQRDPTPGTPENEFKTEHYRRLAYADRYLGRDAPRPGHRTDRGRIYIILGEPNDIARYEGKSSTYDAQVWFYQGKTDLGLPAGFNVVFFRENNRGEYKLYSPVADGPQALLAGYFGGPDYAQAFQKLQEYEPSLAAVSLSLVPGEAGNVYGQPSMSADLLLQRIETAGFKSVETRYAQKFLEYKDIVEVEYTANYLDSDSLIRVFRDESGVSFVHYAVEPKRLSVNEYGGRYSTTLKVNGRVTTSDGRLVHQFDKTVAINLTAEQIGDASRSPFDFQDLFPLVAGDYRFSVLVKNEASKEFTSVERTVRVPAAGAVAEMSQPLLAYRATRLEPGTRRMKAFRVGPYQLYGQPGRVFTRRDTMAVAFQLNGLSDELAAGGELTIAFLRDGQVVRAIRRRPADYPDLPVVVEEVPLGDLQAAHYAVRVTLARAGAEIVSASEEFDLSYAEAVPRPWFSSRILPEAGDPYYDEVLGTELSNLERYDEARVLLGRAFARRPGSAELAASLARVQLALEDPAAAARTLEPFLDPAKPATYEVSVLAAAALTRAGAPGRAVEILERAVASFGVNAALMNALGEGYEALGRTKDALGAYEKSLQLSPDQPRVKARIEALKKKPPAAQAFVDLFRSGASSRA